MLAIWLRSKRQRTAFEIFEWWFIEWPLDSTQLYFFRNFPPGVLRVIPHRFSIQSLHRPAGSRVSDLETMGEALHQILLIFEGP